MTEAIDILTPVFINAPERWDYFVDTVASLKTSCRYPGRFRHLVIDHGSPLYQEEIQNFCKEQRIEFIGRIERGVDTSYFPVFKQLFEYARSAQVLFVEPDHWFFNAYDFVTPALKLFELETELVQVFFRAPLVYQAFKREQDTLLTHDGTRLRRVPIDELNTGWVGRGRMHETFSLMPSLVSRQAVLNELSAPIAGGPLQIELELAKRWENKKLVGYLNGQAFSYHIGAVGGMGGGTSLLKGDKHYEYLWSKKEL